MVQKGQDAVAASQGHDTCHKTFLYLRFVMRVLATRDLSFKRGELSSHLPAKKLGKPAFAEV